MPQIKKTPPETRKYIPIITDDLKSIAELVGSHPARKYVESRKIPVDMWNKLFYAPKFFHWSTGHTNKFKCFTEEDHPRLIIPWYSEDNVLFAYSARAFGPEEPKYFKIIMDDTYPPFFGLDKLDKTRPIYILEGQLDVLFINAVAVGTSTLQLYDNKEAIYIPDRDIRNSQIMKNVKKLIDIGYKVCMLPDTLPGKDINDFVKGGMSIEDIEKVISENTYQGLSAQIHFNNWKKC
jgi:hypothetical protein